MDVEGFRAKLHVLAVDDDRVSLMLIAKQLRHCKYNVTTVMHAETALEMLRARRDAEDQFDLVITDVHMPGMDGFKLLELISLEMDIPVIMLSANDTLETMMKGIKHGARNYLVKPVLLEQLKNLWIHVVKNNMDDPSNSINSYSDDGNHQSQSGDSDDENVANHTSKSSRKKKTEDGTREDKQAKRQRIQWSGQLHRLFVEVVHRLGIDKAVPKKIVEMMNVEGLRREHVASHLQKYRLYLKKISTGTFRSRNPFIDETVWSEGNFINTAGLDTFAGSSSSSNPLARTNSSAAFGTHSMLHTQSVQLMNQRNSVSSVGYGGNLSQIAVPGSQHGVSNFTSVGNSNTNICFSSSPSGSSFANISNSMTFNTSKGFPSGTSSDSPANILNGSPPLAANMEATYYPYRSYASLCMSDPDLSDGNRRKINRFSRLAASSSGQNSEFQNQMAALTRTTPVAGFTEQVAPFNIGSNTNSTVIPNYNSAPGGASSVISDLPGIQMYRDVMESQMLNGGDGSSSLHDHQAAADQLNYNNESVIGTSSGQNGLGDDLDDFFSDCLNQDVFENSDAFIDGDCEFAP
ncbi:hypothetical protein EJB05_41720, partial [Eragrostis curvula]